MTRKQKTYYIKYIVTRMQRFNVNGKDKVIKSGDEIDPKWMDVRILDRLMSLGLVRRIEVASDPTEEER